MGEVPTSTLTTGLDNKAGGSSNDSFDGSLISGVQTLGSADVLNGGGGTDTLNATVLAGTFTPTLTSIETVSLSAGANAAVIDLAASSGYTTLENTGSGAGNLLSVTNISSTAPALKYSNGAGGATFAYTAAAVAGAADSATLTLSNVSAGTVTIAGVETVNLVSTGNANTIDASGIAASTLAISGSQSTALGTLNVGTAVVDASAMTGALSATLGAVVSATVTGSQGADTLTISAVTGNAVVSTGAGNDNIIAATNLTVTDTIDGGAGTADKLTTTNTIAHVLDGATAATTKISNIEQIAITDALDTTLVLANISSAIDTVNLTVTGGAIMAGGDEIIANASSLAVNLGGAALLNTTGQLGGALTVTSAGTGTTDALSISNKAINSTTTLNLNVFNNQSITSAGYEAVTLNTGAVANGAAQTTATITINADTAATPTSYTVTGTNALTTTSLVTNSTGLLTVNAAGMTAQAAGTNTLTISGTTSGTAGTQNITGSNGDDAITIGNFVATISGGLGDDSIVGGSAANNISGGDGNDTLTGGAANDIISGGAGNDSITSGAGNDNLTGGEGNDTFVLASNLTAADTIDGGAGTNTLSIVAGASTSSTIFANVTNVQQVALTGTGTVTLAAPLSATATTFDLSSAEATNLVLAAGYTGDTTVLQTNGAASNGTNVDVITNTANVALTVRGKVADLNTVQITGGTGVDALVLTADSGTASLTSTSGIETITMVAGATATATATLTNAVAATGKTLTVDASAMTNAAATFGFSGKASQLGGVNVTGATAAVNTITLSNFAGANTVTGGSGADSITSGTGTDSLAGGAGSDAYIFAGNLLNTDVVSDSAGTADTLDATINGLTATTGALSISGVEQLNLKTVTAASTINAAGIVGATRINVSDAQNVTITNLAAGTNLGLGTLATGGQTASSVYTGTLTFGLANSAGAADAVTVTLANVADGGVNATLVAAAGIETVTLATSTAALSAATLNIAGVAAPTIAVTGGTTAKVVGLGTLNAATTALNAGTFAGQLTVTGSATGTTFTASGAEAHNITGGAGNDTVTVSAVGTVVQTVAGGAGTDTLNMTLNNTTFSMANVSAVENINLTLGSNSAHSPGTAVNGFNTAELANITLNGGNTLSTFTAGTAIGSGAGFKTFNASAVSGVVDVTIAEAGMALGNTISGGSATTDVLRYTDAGTANTAVTLSGFEKLVVTTATADTGGISLANATGLTSVEVNGTHDYAITGLAAGVAVGVGNAATALTDGKGVSVALASATGAADALTFNLTNTGGVTGTTLTADGVETLNLNQSTTVAATAMGLLIRDVNATNAVNINLSGGIAGAIGGVQDVTFLSTGLESNVATLNAATFAGNMIMADGSRSGTAAMTITGGTGIDTVIMKQANDVLDGGTGVDTLKIVQNAVLGGFLVDLTSTTDQVTTYNGAANAAVQKGFENADLSGVTGSFGADITARAAGSTIVGTANADVITGGAGADTFVATAGNDVVAGGAGNDLFQFTATLIEANSGTTATFDGGTGTNTLQLTAATTGLVDADFRGLTNIQILTLVNGTNGITLGTNANTAGIVTVNGGTGVDTITTGAGSQTIVGGGGADVITGGAGADTITLAAAGAIETVHLAISNADTITGFAVAEDLINLEVLGAGNIAGETAIAANADSTDLTTAFIGVFANGADGTGTTAITDYTNLTQVVAFLAGSLTEGAGEVYVAVINDLLTQKAYVYNVVVDAVTTVAGTIEVGDVALVGVVNISTAAALTTANTTFTA